MFRISPVIDFFAERFLRERALEVSATAVKTRRWRAWRALSVIAAVAAVTLFGPLRAHAQAQATVQDYPTRPIRVLVGATAGGITDLLARALAQELSRTLAQPVVVENRPGAGGNIAAEAMLQSGADGYTLLMCYTGHSINVAYMPRLPFDAMRDFAPITLVGISPLMLLAHPVVPANNARELIAYAKANPRKLNFGVGGLGSSMHAAGDLFRAMAGVDIVNIPYKGTSHALLDVLTGSTQLMFASVVSAAPHVRAGKLKAIGTTGTLPLPAFRDVAPIAEALPGFEAYGYYGLLASAKVPREIVTRLNVAAVKAVNSSAVRALLEPDGARAVGNTPEEFSAFLKADIDKWVALVRGGGTARE